MYDTVVLLLYSCISYDTGQQSVRQYYSRTHGGIIGVPQPTSQAQPISNLRNMHMGIEIWVHTGSSSSVRHHRSLGSFQHR